ncbi:SpvB/TcaC N-terminal domain-containing protein [uncultured Microscilla sp.]|uniref:SpvB/TcaC N-terminal domain-containing protein n=1 Tax=uncultured Microscilla sp. TaxID=432653 RepID=UPI00262919DE|nr:SpvB/TcaC N-terminal domain-containing protein [uncultured Microscilla sp.]
MNQQPDNNSGQFLATDQGKIESNAIEIPSIALPKDGGATPALSLVYNSGAGNGIFGLDWSLSLPSIQRKTNQGLPQYLDAIDSDVFLLSEAEDLVPAFAQLSDSSFALDDAGEYLIDEKTSPDALSDKLGITYNKLIFSPLIIMYNGNKANYILLFYYQNKIFFTKTNFMSQEKTNIDPQDIEAAITIAQRKGFDEIKAQAHDAYETPKSFLQKKNNDSFTPHLTAKNLFSKSYFEVAKKVKEEVPKKRLLRKWRLLETLAQRNNGNLFLLTPHGSFSFTQRLINKYNIQAQIVKMY